MRVRDLEARAEPREREAPRLFVEDETWLLAETLDLPELLDLERASALRSQTHIEDATISAASTNVRGRNLVKTRFFRSIYNKIRGLPSSYYRDCLRR